jgi:hypothetical protein
MKQALVIMVALVTAFAFACASSGGAGGGAAAGGGSAAGGSTIELLGSKARVTGNEIHIDELGRISYWSSKSDEVKWVGVQIPADGSYKVTVRAASANGANVDFIMGDQKISFEIPNTGAWSADRYLDIGKVNLKAGTYEVYLVCTKLTGSYVANVYKVTLTKE